MLRKNGLLCMLVFAVLLPSTLLAQEMMHGKWWHAKPIVEELELTDSERQFLEKKYTESRRKMIDLKSEVEKQRFELDLLLSEKEMDRQKIRERYDSLEQARIKLSKERFDMLMQIRETLGPERYQELKTMRWHLNRKEEKRISRKRSRFKLY